MKHPRLFKDTQGNDYKLKKVSGFKFRVSSFGFQVSGFKFRVFNNQKPQTKNLKLKTLNQ